MGEIRFVGTGETRGYPYLVCKKKLYLTISIASSIMIPCDAYRNVYVTVLMIRAQLSKTFKELPLNELACFRTL